MMLTSDSVRRISEVVLMLERREYQSTSLKVGQEIAVIV